jgi:hypothetical protein
MIGLSQTIKEVLKECLRIGDLITLEMVTRKQLSTCKKVSGSQALAEPCLHGALVGW